MYKSEMLWMCDIGERAAIHKYVYIEIFIEAVALLSTEITTF